MVMYITTDGFKALKEEFEYLKSVERPKVVNEVAEAAAQGDRSENAEYIYGKRRLREIDSRMRFLNNNFAEMSVIDPKLPRGERIFFGATVTVFDEDNNEDLKFQIVGPLDTLDDTHISYQSPVGQALLGKTFDDSVTIHTPKETRHLTICDIEYI
ncbi:MAG: GreA/GreB family elongation factor [Proteobacteria bacterium]|nr:GreA/GreB family elongation factor [Pseudomonadota bacterium]